MPGLFRAAFRLLPACCLLAACGTVDRQDCGRQYDNCLAACQTARTECRQAARLGAGPQYLLYLNRQKQNGEPASRSEADFTDYSACEAGCETGCADNRRACAAEP